jgi:hypothetical protein
MESKFAVAKSDDAARLLISLPHAAGVDAMGKLASHPSHAGIC